MSVRSADQTRQFRQRVLGQFDRDARRANAVTRPRIHLGMASGVIPKGALCDVTCEPTELNGALASRSRVIASETQAAAPSTATLTYAWLRVARRQFMATDTNVSTNRYHDAIEVGLCI